MNFTSLHEFVALAKSRPKRRIAVAAAEDEEVLSAIYQAYLQGIAEPVLIGKTSRINVIAEANGYDLSPFQIIHEESPEKCAEIAVNLIISGNADILMKGAISTAPLMRAVLNKDGGLRKNDLLSHFAFIQTKYYHKLLAVSDAAMNINPSLQDKIAIIKNCTEVFIKLGAEKPKIAVLAPLEKVNDKIQSTVDAAMLKKMNLTGEISDCLIDGPLALDNAVSKKAAEHKGIVSELAGDADLLLAPDLNAGNILYKSMMFLSDGLSAAVILGASAPIVLTSRADNELSKMYSIALAASLV
jgi:phosphate butyryltransferase